MKTLELSVIRITIANLPSTVVPDSLKFNHNAYMYKVARYVHSPKGKLSCFARRFSIQGSQIFVFVQMSVSFDFLTER